MELIGPAADDQTFRHNFFILFELEILWYFMQKAGLGQLLGKGGNL